MYGKGKGGIMMDVKRVPKAYGWLGLSFMTISLTIANIAGDNVAVVPVLAAELGYNIYKVVVIAYFGIGAILAGITAWIGAVTQDELPQTIEWVVGTHAKDLLGWSTLAVCLPASALTGGVFSGAILAEAFGIPYAQGALICLMVYTYMVLYRNKKLMVWINGFTLLLVAILVYVCMPSNLMTGLSKHTLLLGDSNWTVIWALVGYNSGGLRPVLLAETGTRLSCRWTAVGIAVAAKWLEGMVTLIFAYAVIETGASGILPLGQIFAKQWGTPGHLLFIIGCLTIFFSCMVPAMVVNTHQIKGLTGMSCTYALLWAFILVVSIMFLGMENLLIILSVAGVGAALLLGLLLWKVMQTA
jgi:hypothetical protein